MERSPWVSGAAGDVHRTGSGPVGFPGRADGGAILACDTRKLTARAAGIRTRSPEECPMSLRLMASACLFAALALSQPATAQSSTLRGPWLGAGLGTASASVNCELCVEDRNGGFSGYLTGGITLSP